MIVCICSNYSASGISTEITKGADTLEKLQKVGICANCKCCKNTVTQILKEAVQIKKV
jgi:bacterioferritin-associated ferredoxin